MRNYFEGPDSKNNLLPRPNLIGVVSGEERKAAAGEATKDMTGTQHAATKGAGNKENKAALKSIVKEAECKKTAAKNINKPNGPKDKKDNKAKGDAGRVSAKTAGTKANAGASGRVYAGAKPQLVTANKLITAPTLSTAKMAAVPLTVKANAPAKHQKNEPVVKTVPHPRPAGSQFPASCAYNYNGSKATVVERKQEDAFEGKQKEPVKTVPSPIPADVSASCTLDFNSSNATEVERKQEGAFKGVLDKHSEAVPQRNNEVAKENKEEEEFGNRSFRHSGDELDLHRIPTQMNFGDVFTNLFTTRQ